MNLLSRRLNPRLAKLWSLVFRPAAFTAGSVTLAILLFAISPAILETIELNWIDLRFRARGPIAPGQAVAIAAIDEKSLAEEGRWPWPRDRIAALVRALSNDGAKVVGFDVVFAEAEHDSRLALIDRIEQATVELDINEPGLSAILRRSREAVDHDRVLANTLERTTTPVVLGYFFHMNQDSVGFALDEADIERRFEALDGSEYPIIYRDPQASSEHFLKAYAPQGNVAAIASKAASSGYFSVASDRDGVVRWMPLVVQGGDNFYGPLSVLTVWHYLERPTLAVRSGPYGVEGVQIGERFIPTDELGRMFINYRGPARTFPTYSVSDILADRLPKGTFSNRIVLVGATATSLADIRTSPYGPLYPGPEVHASVIDNMFAGDIIERPSWSRVFDLSAILIMGLVAGVALPRMRAVSALVFAGGLLLAFVFSAYWLFVYQRIALNMVYPVFTLGATYTMLTLYRYLSEERERRQIKAAFQHYVAPEVIEIILEDPVALKLGGHERVLTGLISDLAGFTTFSEARSASEVIAVLSDYYGEMTEEVFNVQGTLVEYVGDELFAIYGAPVEQPDHAQRACDSALAMRARRARINEQWADLGRPTISARTGISTGTMLVGNVGSKYRFHYGAMGDPVNLASRLEGLNKIYGTEILLSGNTAEHVVGLYHLRELDRVRVKGRVQAQSIYELIASRNEELPPAQQQLLVGYQSALEAYRDRRWPEAINLFDQCLQLDPSDEPSILMRRRCVRYRQSPPPADWNGTFEDRRGAKVV